MANSAFRRWEMRDSAFQDHLSCPYRKGIPESYSVLSSVCNPACGDEVRIALVLSAAILTEIWHEAKGCLLCQASASLISLNAEGKSLNQALSLTESDIFQWLEIPITPGRRECVLLPFEAFRRALHSLQQDDQPVL